MKKSIIFLNLMILIFTSCKKEILCSDLALVNGNILNQEEYLIIESVLCDYSKDSSDFIHVSQESLSSDEFLSFSIEHNVEYLDSIPIEAYKIRNESTFIWDELFTVKSNLISKEELLCYFLEGIGWDNYYSSYEDSRGYLRFGRPLIVEDKGFIEYAHFCNSLCAYGYFAILEKENGKWIVKENIFLWIS